MAGITLTPTTVITIRITTALVTIPYGGYAYAICGYRRHRAGAIGAVAGTFGGGIIGAAATHGNPAYTMLGAGLGALTGSLIGHNSHPYPC